MGDTAAVGAGQREFFARFWLSAELLFAIAVVLFSSRKRLAWAKPLMAAALSFSVVLEAYEVFILRAFARMPVLYNDVLLIWDGLNLAFDLLPGGAFTTVAIIFVVICLLMGLNLKGLSWVQGWRDNRLNQVPLVLLVVVGLASGVLMIERSPVLRDSVIQSPWARLMANADRSNAMRKVMADLATQPPSPSAAQQLEQVILSQTPDIYLLVLESYGSVLLEHPELKGGHRALMDRVAATLDGFGYTTYSQQSISPVVGGASWQATSTLLSGIEITNQHLYTQLYDSGAYGLPSFLKDRGYSTWTVQAGYRTRPGRPVSNPWGYDHTLYFEELNYKGKRWGWGVVPDQYSLGFASQKIHERGAQPNFMMFTGVSTHAPWNEGPGVREDWRELGILSDENSSNVGFWPKLKERLGTDTARCLSLSCFQKAINSEWDVIIGFINSLQADNALVIVVGDHQPPVLPVKGSTVPIHLISRGVQGLERLEALGFVQGLMPANHSPVRHEGLFTLLVDLLNRQSDEGAEKFEIYRPSGLSPASLMSRQ